MGWKKFKKKFKKTFVSKLAKSVGRGVTKTVKYAAPVVGVALGGPLGGLAGTALGTAAATHNAKNKAKAIKRTLGYGAGVTAAGVALGLASGAGPLASGVNSVKTLFQPGGSGQPAAAADLREQAATPWLGPTMARASDRDPMYLGPTMEKSAAQMGQGDSFLGQLVAYGARNAFDGRVTGDGMNPSGGSAAPTMGDRLGDLFDTIYTPNDASGPGMMPLGQQPVPASEEGGIPMPLLLGAAAVVLVMVAA